MLYGPTPTISQGRVLKSLKNLSSKNFSNSLVFCGSKKSTEKLAELLSQRVRLHYTFSTQDVDLIRGIQDAKLRELVYRGVAFHHAGLPPSDKVILAQLYCLRKILILTCTSTLAFGVNLPAHLVVVKGTSHYRGILSSLFLWTVIVYRMVPQVEKAM